MSYDFILFEPDRDESGAPAILGDGAWMRLRLRRDAATITPTPLLERLRDRINTDAPFLTREGIELADGAVRLRGDRCLQVSVTDHSVQDTVVWLAALAAEQDLGLAAATDQEVLLIGDEIRDFSTETAELDQPVVSPAQIPLILAEVQAAQEKSGDGDFAAAFLIVSDLSVAETYLQTTFRPGDDTWQLEYRDGSVARHFQVQVDSRDRVTDAFARWIARDESLKKDLDWRHLDIPEAAIEYDTSAGHGLDGNGGDPGEAPSGR